MIPGNFSAIGTALANHLWQSTLFAIVAAVFTLALRKNQASLRHHLWLAASLKFLVPFSLLVSLGSRLATLHGSADSQPVFYFVLQTMGQPFHRDLDAQSLLRWLPAMVAILWLAGFVTVIGLWWLRWRSVAAAMHMVVEAIFWFHPLVWWLGTRLVEERERACDEAVLLLGNQPEVYAESILKTCEFCVASPLAFVSGVTGADLKQRIVRIMTQGSADKLGFLKKLVLVAISLGAVAAPIVAGLIKAPAAAAQSALANMDKTPMMMRSASNHVADPQQIYHVGGDVSAPVLAFAPDPEYTEKARRAKYQ